MPYAILGGGPEPRCKRSKNMSKVQQPHPQRSDCNWNTGTNPVYLEGSPRKPTVEGGERTRRCRSP